MIDKTLKNDWKAWIDIQPPRKSEGGTLYVTGTIKAGDERIHYSISKAVPQGFNPKELILKVEPRPTKGDHAIPLRYEEALKTQDQYESVRVRIEGVSDIEIQKIEIVQ